MKLRKMLAFLLGMILITTLSACGSGSAPEGAEPDTEAAEIPLDDIYPDYPYLNLFLNNYNRYNPDNQITSEMIQVDPNSKGNVIIIHEGSTKYTLQGYQEAPAVLIRVFVDGADYEDLYMRLMKGYNASLSDEELEEYWAQAVTELDETPSNEDVYTYINRDEDGSITDDTLSFGLVHGYDGNLIGGMTMAGNVK